MELTAETVQNYVRHVFAGIDKVLDRMDDDTVNVTPASWGTNSVAGLVVHCCELAPFWFLYPGLGREAPRDREAEFAATATVAELRDRVDRARNETIALVADLDAGPTATDHEFRAFLPGDDDADASVVLHVFEELYQHLGHMEVTADALGR